VTPIPQISTPSGKGIEWKASDYTWKFGGYIKVDAIHDFDAIGSTDSFDPRTIPTGAGNFSDENTRIHARQTRLNAEVRGPSSAGDFRAFVEGDFFGDKNAFRLRHAYGTIGEALGGQTWTTFMDEDAMPETLDFESPVAFPMIRQAQVRWTRQLEGGSYFAIAIEDPDSDVQLPAAPGVSEEPLPDVDARYYLKLPSGHVQLSAFGGMASFDPDVGNKDNVALWGLNLATKMTTTGSDNAIVQLTVGDGVGRYRGGVTAAPDASGDLEAVGLVGTMASYQHYWSKDFRTTIAYSFGKGDLPAGSLATSSEKLQTLSANLIWQFANRAWTGVEYLYGTNETFDGNNASANRLQFSIRYDL
jgi:hypothetical protein